MSEKDIETEDKGGGIHLPTAAVGAASAGAVGYGALALGAVAVGAFAIGGLVIGGLAFNRMRKRKKQSAVDHGAEKGD